VRQVDGETVEDLEAEAQRLQRVAAARGPTVAGTQAVDGEDVLGDLQHPPLLDADGGVVLRRATPWAGSAAQQGGPVDLAVGVPWQLGDEVGVVGAHVRGQGGGEVTVVGVVGEVVAEDEEGEQFAAVGFVAAGAYVGLADGWLGQDLPLHLTRFDAEAAHLDLAVGPADVGDPAFGVLAYEVAGAIPTPLSVRLVLVRQSYEAAAGLLRELAVADGQRRAGEQEFGDLARFGGAVVLGAEQYAGAGERGADRDGVAGEVAWDGVAQGEGRRLRRPVHVVQDGAGSGVGLVPAAHDPCVELFAADEYLSDGGEAVGHLLDHRVEQGRRDEQRVDAPLAEHPGESGRAVHVRVIEYDADAAGQERDPHLETERVEGGVGQAGEAGAGP
jgi:hypothetical protein